MGGDLSSLLLPSLCQMLDQMLEREEAQCTQRRSAAPDWSEGEERFRGQRVDSSGKETPSADGLSATLHHLATLRTTEEKMLRSSDENLLSQRCMLHPARQKIILQSFLQKIRGCLQS